MIQWIVKEVKRTYCTLIDDTVRRSGWMGEEDTITIENAWNREYPL
jgi:hypothetical protein